MKADVGATDFSWCIYEHPKFSPDIRVKAKNNIILLNGTTGIKTWPAALKLTEFLLTYDNIIGKDIETYLDLGCGNGFLSAALSKLASQCAKIYALDCSSLACNLTRETIKASQCDNVVVVEDDWSSATILANLTGLKFDFVVVADIFFDVSLAHSLFGFLAKLLEVNPKCEILAAATIRSNETQSYFECAALRYGLIFEEFEDVSITHHFYYDQTAPIKLILVRR